MFWSMIFWHFSGDSIILSFVERLWFMGEKVWLLHLSFLRIYKYHYETDIGGSLIVQDRSFTAHALKFPIQFSWFLPYS